MKRFKFNMEDGGAFNCIARDFASACLLFDSAGYDPRLIDSVEVCLLFDSAGYDPRLIDSVEER